MPNKFSGDLIARGFAKGINQGTQVRQTFGERLGAQKAQKSRDDTYQNFLELMQKDRQSFQNMRDLKQHGLDMIKMQERDRLAGIASDPNDTDDSSAAAARTRKIQQDDRKIRLEEWKAGQGVFMDRIKYLEGELKSINEFGSDTDVKRKGFVTQQLRRTANQLNTWLIENPPPGRPDVSRTIREENELFKFNQKTKKEEADQLLIDDPLGLF